MAQPVPAPEEAPGGRQNPEVLSPPVLVGEFSALSPEDRWVGYRVLEALGDSRAVDEAMGDLFSDAPWLQARSAQYLARLDEAGAFLPLTQSAQRGTLLSQAYVNDALLRLPEPLLPVLLDLARAGQPHLIRIAILELPRYRREEREALLAEILCHLGDEHASAFLRYVEREKDEAMLEALFFRLESLPLEIREPFIELFFLRHPVEPYAAFLEGRLATLTGDARLSVVGLLGRAYGGRGEWWRCGFWPGSHQRRNAFASCTTTALPPAFAFKPWTDSSPR